MGRGLRWAGLAALLLFLAISFFLMRFYVQNGGLYTVEDPVDLACTPLAVTPAGPEDIAIDRGAGRAYVSAFDRRRETESGDGEGALLMIDLDAATPVIENVTPAALEGFAPHGIGLYDGGNGEKLLFVVNHADGETIEILKIGESGALTHLETIRSDAFVSVNDVLPVGPRSFYATNDSGVPQSSPMAQLNGLIGRGSGRVVHFDGTEARPVTDRLQVANGLALSPDGKTLYVAETLGRQLRFFDRDPETDALTPAGYLALASGLDNIAVDETGSLYIGAHPNVIDFLGHAGDPASPSPSQVLKATPGERGGEVRTIYLNDGSELSGSSVAAPYGDRLLIGAVFEPKLLVCDLPAVD